jgi:hypothetical protein
VRAASRLGWFAVAVVAGAVVASPSAAAPRPLAPGGYQIQVFPGPAGSRSVLNKISSDGTAVGQRLDADGTSHAVIFGRPLFPGGSPLAGNQSALVAINANDEMAGTLIGAGGPNPLFLPPGGQPKVLPVQGDANAIAVGPLVAVTATGGDGQQHAGVWNPATGATRDLGLGAARGIRADGTVVGKTADGHAAFWTSEGVAHTLPFQGTLIQLNLSGEVVGIRTEGGGPHPILLNLAHPDRVTDLKLLPGYPFGTAKGISDSDLVVGDGFKLPTGGLPSVGIVWSHRTPFLAQNLVQQPSNSAFIADLSGVDDNGLIVGSVIDLRVPASPTQQENDFLGTDLVKDKISDLMFLGFNANSDPFHELRSSLNNIDRTLAQASGYYSEHRTNNACRRLTAARHAFEALQFPHAVSAARQSNLDALKAAAIHDVDEVATEIPCP